MTRGLEPGSAIPTERELCTLYGVSRTTVRQGLQALVHEGHLYRRQGRGTFVAPPKLVQTMQLHGHTEEMEAQGLRPGSRPLSAEDVPASPELAAFFGLTEGAHVHRILRVRVVVRGRRLVVSPVGRPRREAAPHRSRQHRASNARHDSTSS